LRHLIFTDLDGSLLDRDTYSWAAAEDSLREIKRRRVPLILVTSKTRAEVEVLRRQLGQAHPFVTENGGGIFIPARYFSGPVEGAHRRGDYHCYALARPYTEIIAALKEIAEEAGTKVVGFHQMTAREIARRTGLNSDQAELARRRDFDEPFFFARASQRAKQKFARTAMRRGLQVVCGGRFWHLVAGSDKGRAVRELIRLYRAARRHRWHSVGLGDSATDLPMLLAVDLAVLLPQPGGRCAREVVSRLPHVMRGSLPGPAGWNQAVLQLLAASRPEKRRGARMAILGHLFLMARPPTPKRRRLKPR